MPAHRAAPSRGFTYLWLLFALAAGAAALAAAAQAMRTQAQREREAELEFRGREIARALSTYRAATPGSAKQLPRGLEELLEDRRGPRVLRHLRRLYDDPFTGAPDWALVQEDDRIAGVHSRSPAPALRIVDLPRPSPEGEAPTVSMRVFRYEVLPDAAASAPGSAASSVSGAASSAVAGKPDVSISTP
jgi:type II secretory pathway pseudopilin PulG